MGHAFSKCKNEKFHRLRDSLISCCVHLFQLENLNNIITNSEARIHFMNIIPNIYNDLHLMQTDAKFISNSKVLHFLFPNMCLPMDGENTLTFFYGKGNTEGSLNKYLEINQFFHEILSQPLNFNQYLDNGWNTNIPKLIDNSIILNIS